MPTLESAPRSVLPKRADSLPLKCARRIPEDRAAICPLLSPSGGSRRENRLDSAFRCIRPGVMRAIRACHLKRGRYRGNVPKVR